MQRKRLRRVNYIPTVIVLLANNGRFTYRFTWRGLAALLILERGQCEGLRSGMGESRKLPCLFCFQAKQIINAEFGESIGTYKY